MLSSMDDRLNGLVAEIARLQNEYDLEAFCQSRERNCHQRLVIDKIFIKIDRETVNDIPQYLSFPSMQI